MINIRSAVWQFIPICVYIKRVTERHLSERRSYRGRSYNLIHSIYRRNAQLKGIRLNKAVKEGREAGLRAELPVRKRHARRKERKRRRRRRRKREKRRNSPVMHAYMRVLRNNNLPPLITSAILSPEVH